MAVMLADERQGDFRTIGDFGFTQNVPRLPRSSSFIARLDAGRTVALDDPIAAAWFAAEEVEGWRDQGIYYFVPCVFEGAAIAALALGRKETDQPPNSEDLALLTPVVVNATEVPLQSLSAPAAVAGTILLLENVTDRVRLEEQLQISEKMASIGLLAAGVAHEVNTPLTGISSFTQMLLEGADPGDPRTVLLEKIERQTFRAAKIVNGLLNLSRPGTSSDERTEVDLNAVITDVFSLLEHQFEVGKIKVRRELSQEPAAAVGIEHQLQQVFLNLFLNPRDAMPRGGWLQVATRVSGGQVIAEVTDTGSGIPPEQLARIYHPFFTTKSIGRGTGLGLSITYGI